MRLQIDVEDAIASTAFGASAAVTAGIADVSMFGFSLSQSLATLQGRTITIAFVVTVLALVMAYATNRVHKSPNKTYNINSDLKKIAVGRATVETYLLGATILIVLLMGLDLVGFRTFVQSNMAIGTVVWIIEGAGIYVIGYLG